MSLLTWCGWFLVSLTQGWLILQLTDSPFWVGLSAGIRGLSLTISGVAGGVIADRVDRRRVLLLAASLGLATALGAALLVLGGVLRPWHVLVLMSLMGLQAAVERPATSGLMYDLVGPERLLNASAVRLMGIALVQFLSGLAGGAVLARVGAGYNFLLAAGAYLGAAVCVGGLRPPPQPMRAVESFLDTVTAGLRYALGTRPIRLLLSLSLAIEGFGFACSAMMPVMARDVLRVGGFGLGVLVAAAGLGNLVSTATLAARRHGGRPTRMLVTAAAAFGALIALFGLSRWFPLSVGLVLAGQASGTVYDVAMYTVLARTSSDAMRGRVLGFFSSTTGFSQSGGLLIGVMALALGTPGAVTVGGALTVIGALALGSGLRDLDRRRQEDPTVSQEA
jgi:MFS family permease